MLQGMYVIAENRKIAPNTYEMILKGDTSEIQCPGQFVELKVPGCYLRRPFSVMTWDSDSFRIMYKSVGNGTELMTELEPGTALDALTGLGNGFDISKAGDCPLLVAGGSGVSPIYGLAERLRNKGITPLVLLGFPSISNVVYDDELREIGCRVLVATEDGTCGIHGLVTDAMEGIQVYSYLYCCGPDGMMKAAFQEMKSEGQFSLEARMGCGFGACMGCSIETKLGPKRVCKDGPVFDREVLTW